MNFDFKTEQEVKSVSVKIPMPPQYKVEYVAFKVGANQFAITGNVFHAAGTLFIEVRAVMENLSIYNCRTRRKTMNRTENEHV